MILKSLIEKATAHCHNKQVIDVRIGLSYTAVELDDSSVGLAMTFHRDLPSGCLSMDFPLSGQPVANVIEKAVSDNLIERTVAMAAINAVLNRPQEQLIKADTLELLNAGQDDTVGMVGYFGPLVSKLKNRVKDLIIFEKNTATSEMVFPEEQLEEKFRNCSLAIITSTSLLNFTFERIVKAAQYCRRIALVGASTPLAADVFNQWGIDLLSGVIVHNNKETLRVVSESGGMTSFKPYIDKVNLVCQE